MKSFLSAPGSCESAWRKQRRRCARGWGEALSKQIAFEAACRRHALHECARTAGRAGGRAQL